MPEYFISINLDMALKYGHNPFKEFAIEKPEQKVCM